MSAPEAAAPPWAGARTPAWAGGAAIPEWLALRAGTRPIVIFAPHGGRRRRAIRRGDSVNDLFTAPIAWQLAERLGAHAIVNHGLDRNDIDLNRISQLTTRAPEVLAMLASAVGAASAGGVAALVVFVHGWNMVVPCCDIGIGLKRRGGVLSGRHPTLARERYDTTIAAIERELEARGLGAAIGRRYTASGRDNAAQLFSGRHAAHENATVAALGKLAQQGRVDGVQLELGIALRWPGARRIALVDGLVAALETEVAQAASPRVAWDFPVAEDHEHLPLEPGFSLQAILDDEGTAATFCGVEATGPRSMTARFSVVSTDGSMMLLVGEGEWSGAAGCYDLEGFAWRSSASRVELTLRAPMIRYPTHDAYLDLEQGLDGSRLVDADIRLVFEATGEGHGRLHGHVRAGDVVLDVEAKAFFERGGRGTRGEGVRVVSARSGDRLVIESSHAGSDLAMHSDEAVIRAGEASSLREAAIVARVPVWRPVGHGVLVRWTFGIVRCRYRDGDDESAGLFESLEVFRRPT